jgi:hypothetical protein
MSETSETSEAPRALTFTQAVAELDEAGYNSMGFAIEDGNILCVDCGETTTVADAKVGGLLGYETDEGQGLVLVLACPSCHAKGMLFAGPQILAGPDAPIVNALAAQARHEA